MSILLSVQGDRREKDAVAADVREEGLLSEERVGGLSRESSGKRNSWPSMVESGFNVGPAGLERSFGRREVLASQDEGRGGMDPLEESWTGERETRIRAKVIFLIPFQRSG